jgi:hypothetical protein
LLRPVIVQSPKAASARATGLAAFEPMALGNMRANGVRSLDVSCWQCHHRAILSAAPWSDGLFYPNELRLLRVRRDSSAVS